MGATAAGRHSSARLNNRGGWGQGGGGKGEGGESEPPGKASHKVECCPQLCSSSSSEASCIECPQTYKEPSTQTTLRYGAVKNTSPLQTTGCNKHSK